MESFCYNSVYVGRHSIRLVRLGVHFLVFRSFSFKNLHYDAMTPRWAPLKEYKIKIGKVLRNELKNWILDNQERLKTSPFRTGAEFGAVKLVFSPSNIFFPNFFLQTFSFALVEQTKLIFFILFHLVYVLVAMLKKCIEPEMHLARTKAV